MFGSFFKCFNSFEKGICALIELSSSAQQAITKNGDVFEDVTYGGYSIEANVVRNLSENVIHNRPTGNGIGWDEAKIEITAGSVIYTTTGNLKFGWSVDSSDYHDFLEWGNGGNKWTFFITHPLGEEIPNNSSLRTRATELGWEEL